MHSCDSAREEVASRLAIMIQLSYAELEIRKSYLRAEAMQKFFAPIGATEQQIAAARIVRARTIPIDASLEARFRR